MQELTAFGGPPLTQQGQRQKVVRLNTSRSKPNGVHEHTSRVVKLAFVQIDLAEFDIPLKVLGEFQDFSFAKRTVECEFRAGILSRT